MPQWASPVPVSKATYYDRNARPSYHGFTGTSAPHGPTLRVAYTVPYPYAAFFEALFISIIVATAAGVPGYKTIFVTCTNHFAVTETMLTVTYLGNVVNDEHTNQQSTFGIMFTGDTIDAYTYDNGTGGTVNYNIAIKGVEFEY